MLRSRTASVMVLVFCAALGVGLVWLSRPVEPLAAQSASAEEPASPATPVVQPSVDPNLYNAQLLSITNLPPPRQVTKVHWIPNPDGKGKIKTTTTTTKYASTDKGVPLKNLWPAKAPLPKVGALLPFDRIIAYYGNLYSKHMGVLGEYPPEQMLSMLRQTTAQWQAADPSTHAVPALDYIAVAAQATPGGEGKYVLRMPDTQIDKVLGLAGQVNGLVFLDLQVGLSNVQQEIPRLAPYLKLPQVELSLDPEFAMHNGKRPGKVIGTLDAADINWAAQYLAQLVTANGLPPKLLVIHRFTQPMVTHYRQIQPLPQVQIVMDMDGFGYPAEKIKTYADFIQNEPVQFTGFKLFYKNDVRRKGSHLLMPKELLKLTPRPSYIQYQ